MVCISYWMNVEFYTEWMLNFLYIINAILKSILMQSKYTITKCLTQLYDWTFTKNNKKFSYIKS